MIVICAGTTHLRQRVNHEVEEPKRRSERLRNAGRDLDVRQLGIVFHVEQRRDHLPVRRDNFADLRQLALVVVPWDLLARELVRLRAPTNTRHPLCTRPQS